MRTVFVYGTIILCTTLIVVEGDRKWKQDKEGGTEKRSVNIDKKEERQTFASPKRFIGRIEHGKVKVLRRKDDINNFCFKKATKNACGTYGREDNGNNSSEEIEKPKKKIRYSIKFQHEKQKKKEFNGDNSILRLHRKEQKYRRHDDSESSEEDEHPVKKRYIFSDEDNEQ